MLGINIMLPYPSTPLLEGQPLCRRKRWSVHVKTKELASGSFMSREGADHVGGSLRKDFALRGEQHVKILTVREELL